MTPRWASVVRVLFDALSDIANGRASLRLRDPNNARLVAEDAIEHRDLDVVPDHPYAHRPGARLPDVPFRTERAPGQLAAGPDAQKED